eukprot:403375456
MQNSRSSISHQQKQNNYSSSLSMFPQKESSQNCSQHFNQTATSRLDVHQNTLQNSFANSQLNTLNNLSSHNKSSMFGNYNMKKSQSRQLNSSNTNKNLGLAHNLGRNEKSLTHINILQQIGMSQHQTQRGTSRTTLKQYQERQNHQIMAQNEKLQDYSIQNERQSMSEIQTLQRKMQVKLNEDEEGNLNSNNNSCYPFDQSKFYQEIEARIYNNLLHQLKAEFQQQINQRFNDLQSILLDKCQLTGMITQTNEERSPIHASNVYNEINEPLRLFPKRVRSQEYLTQGVCQNPLSTTVAEIENHAPQMNQYIQKRKDTMSPRNKKDNMSPMNEDSYPLKPNKNVKNTSKVDISRRKEDERKVAPQILGEITENRSVFNSSNAGSLNTSPERPVISRQNFKCNNNSTLYKFHPQYYLNESSSLSITDVGQKEQKPMKSIKSARMIKFQPVLKEAIQNLNLKESSLNESVTQLRHSNYFLKQKHNLNQIGSNNLMFKNLSCLAQENKENVYLLNHNSIPPSNIIHNRSVGMQNISDYPMNNNSISNQIIDVNNIHFRSLCNSTLNNSANQTITRNPSSTRKQWDIKRNNQRNSQLI